MGILYLFSVQRYKKYLPARIIKNVYNGKIEKLKSILSNEMLLPDSKIIVTQDNEGLSFDFRNFPNEVIDIVKKEFC
jgi:hypothetical protein